jgi:hypothetical protein
LEVGCSAFLLHAAANRSSRIKRNTDLCDRIVASN